MSEVSDDAKVQAELAARRKMEREKQELLERARLLREEQLRLAEIEKEERARRLEQEMEIKKEEERKRQELEQQRWLEEQKRLEEEEAMARRIALEERKIVIAQRKLESIRLLTALFEQIRVAKMGDERERRMLEDLLEARKRIEREKIEEETRRLEAERLEQEKREQEDALQQMLMRKLTRRETPPPTSKEVATKNRTRDKSDSSRSDDERSDRSRRSDSEMVPVVTATGRGLVRGRGMSANVRRLGGGRISVRSGGFGFGGRTGLSHFGGPQRGGVIAGGPIVVEPQKGPVDPRLPFARRQQYVPMALRKILNADQSGLLDVSDPEKAAMIAKAAASLNVPGGKKGVSKRDKKNTKNRNDKSDKNVSKKKKKPRSRSRSSSSSSSRSRSSSISSRSRSGSSRSSSYSTTGSSSRTNSSASSRSRSRSPNRSKKLADSKNKQKKTHPSSRSPSPVQSKKIKKDDKREIEKKSAKYIKEPMKFAKKNNFKSRSPEKRVRQDYSARSPHRGKDYGDEPSKNKLKRFDGGSSFRGGHDRRGPTSSPRTVGGYRGVVQSRPIGSGAKQNASKYPSRDHRRDLSPSPLPKQSGGSKKQQQQRQHHRGIAASTSGGTGGGKRQGEPRYTFYSHTR